MTTRSGYAITIKGFVPTDPKDLAGHRAILDAIENARQRAGSAADVEEATTSADPLFQMMKVEQFDVKPVSRRAKGEGEAS